MLLLGRSQDVGARLAELRAHPENHGMEPTDSGVLELRAHPLVARARRENAVEGINERSQPCQHSPETTPTLLTFCGLTPELSRAAKRLRLE